MWAIRTSAGIAKKENVYAMQQQLNEAAKLSVNALRAKRTLAYPIQWGQFWQHDDKKSERIGSVRFGHALRYGSNLFLI